MADKDLANRVFAAINALEQKLKRRLTLAELGERVGNARGDKAKAPAPSVVARWSKGQQTPRTREDWSAFAAALEVDPGWLTFGTGAMSSGIPVVAEKAPAYSGTTPTQERPPAAKKSRKSSKKTG